MGIVLKSKFKDLKGDIRGWNKVEYGNVEMRLSLLRDEIEELDGKSDNGLYQIKRWRLGRESLRRFGKVKRHCLFKDLNPNGSKRKMLILSSSIVV